MKKGFTLVELLAVIIVLGVVSMITVNVVTNNIETTKKKTFEVNAIGLLDAAKEYVTKEMENNDFPEEGIEAKNLNMKNNPFISGIVRRNEQDQIILENVTDGKYCVNGVRSNLEITEGNCVKEDDTAPTLKIKELKTKRTSTQIMIKTQDNGSGINYYEYCINEKCEKVEKNGSKEIIKEVITINNLEPNKEYVVKVKVVNGKELEEVKEVKIKTKEIEEPTFKISSSTHATTKELIITYPSVEEGYIKGYEIKGNEKTVNEKEVKLEITEAIKVVAYIKKDNEIVISNTIEIVGIDLEGPKVNVLVPDIDSWSKTKKVTIEAQDEGVGLALRPYSYDGGKTWVKENKKEYKEATKLDIKVRDRLGNITDKFILNGTTECTLGKPCALEKVDSLPIDITIEVIDGILKNNFYINKDLYIKVTLTDYYLLNNEKTYGGSGIKYKNLSIKKTINNSSSKITEFISKSEEMHKAVYMFKLTEVGEIAGKIEVNISDAVDNPSSKDLTFKIDRVVPTINAKKGLLGLKPNESYDFKNNVTYKFGPSGGTVTCNPINNNILGNKDVTVTCTAVGNNELSKSTTFEAKHQVAGTGYSCKTGTRCKYEYYNCTGYFDPDTGGNTVSCNCGSRTDRVGTDDPSSYMGRCCEDEDVYGTCYSCPTGSSHSKCPSGTAVNICCY